MTVMNSANTLIINELGLMRRNLKSNDEDRGGGVQKSTAVKSWMNHSPEKIFTKDLLSTTLDLQTLLTGVTRGS